MRFKSIFWAILATVFLPMVSSASVLQFVGGETGGFNDAELVGTGSVTASVAKSGDYSYRLNPTTTATGFVATRPADAAGSNIISGSSSFGNNVYLSFWVRVDTFPSSGAETFIRGLNTSNASTFLVRLNSDRTLTMLNSSSVAIATTTATLTASTWHYVNVRVDQGAPGAYEIKIDNTSVLSGTGTFSGSYRSIQIGKPLNVSGNSVDMYVDDLVIDDASFGTSGQKIIALMPVSNGTYTAWTTDDYTNVDERPHDNTTTVADSAGDGTKVSWNLTDTADAGVSGTIQALKNILIIRENQTTAGTFFQSLLKSSSAEATTTSSDPTTFMGSVNKLFLTDPNTSSAWTTAGVDAVEVGGISVTQSSTYFRITQASAQVLFTPADVTAPIISLVATSSVLATTATVTWTTNEAATSTVEYGTTASYGLASTSASLVTSHSIGLTGLSQNTLYHFRVSSRDAAGNIATSSDYTFTTAIFDNTPPVISSIATSTAASTSTITWSTNEPAVSKVVYGTASDTYTLSSTSPSLVTSHSIGLSGLSPLTRYYFRVVSTDSQGNIATSTEGSISTTAYALTDNLIGYYTFDEGTIADSSGNGNNGSITGSTTAVTGKMGSALLFGTTSYGSIPAAAGSGLDLMSDFTVSFWIKPYTFTSNVNWVGRDSPFWKLGTASGNTFLNVNVGGVSLTTGEYKLEEFMHVVGAYSTSTRMVTLYKDNTFLATSTLGNFASNNYAIYINDDSTHILMAMDDLRIYNRTLSSAEVGSLYRLGLSGGAGNVYNFNVIKTGTGSGTVSGSGISCGSDCYQFASTSALISLTAAAASGSTFTGWSGGGCSGTGSCTVSVSGHTIVTATFTANNPPSSSGTTYIVKADGSEDFTTVQACANAVLPGDTCEVSAGTYAETLTPTVSGTYSSPIRIKAASGATVNLSKVNLDSVDFVRLEGIKIDTISQWGIEFDFDTHYEVGVFANEDYWVKGPVTITAMTPAFQMTASTTLNGAEVNPVYVGPQGFDSRAGTFNSYLNITLPYTAQPWESIVKSKSRVTSKSICDPTDRPCLQTASVLTVVSDTLPDYGAGVFRPPYSGIMKPLFPASAVRASILPSLAYVNGATTTVSLATVKGQIERVQLDHKGGATGRVIHPSENMGDYGGDIASRNNDTVLRLMLADTTNAKMPVLLPFLQYGIDSYYMYLTGQEWYEQGGHTPGRRILFAFTATMFDNAEIRDMANTETIFSEDLLISHRSEAGRALFGYQGEFDDYWTVVNNGGSSGNRTIGDPYGYVDGGPYPGSFYQPVLSGPYRASGLATLLLPELRDAWKTSELNEIIDYSDRISVFGLWSYPDPCMATSTGGGPNGSDCVLHTNLTATSTMSNFTCQSGLLCNGRFHSNVNVPGSSHGTALAGFGYQTDFQQKMWDAYRLTVSTGLPSVSAIASSTTATTATITWTTNEASDSQVNFSPVSTFIASSTLDATLKTSHSVTLTSLKPCAKYFFRVRSLDASRNPVVSSTGTFRTTGCTGGAPVLSDAESAITSSGGSVSLLSSGKGLALTVPPSFASTTNSAYFQIKQLSKADFISSAGSPTNKTAVGNYVYNLASLPNSTSTLSSFDSSLTVTITYDDSDVSNMDESTLRIHRYDGSSWNELSGCSVNSASNTVTCSTTRFSDFVLFGETSSSSGSNNVDNDTQPAVPMSGTGTWRRQNAVVANQRPSNPMTLGSFIEILISLGVIPADKAAEARAIITASTEPKLFARDLQLHDRGEDVKALQNFLISKGYLSSGNNIGIFGPMTLSALKKYQASVGLPATGYFGPRTRTAVSQ